MTFGPIVVVKSMSFSEVLAELPSLTVAQRQQLVSQVFTLDSPDLSAEDAALIERRLQEHRANPGSAVTMDEMKTSLRNVWSK